MKISVQTNKNVVFFETLISFINNNKNFHPLGKKIIEEFQVIKKLKSFEEFQENIKEKKIPSHPWQYIFLAINLNDDLTPKSLSLADGFGPNREKAYKENIYPIIKKIHTECTFEEIYKMKEKLLADLHSSLRVWCEAFVESDKYKDFLKKSLDKTLMLVKGQNISISLLKKDVNRYSNLFKEEADKFNKQMNVEFIESKGDIIGGFVITDKDYGMIFDLSIKSLLDEGKGYTGQLLYKELDGVLA